MIYKGDGIDSARPTISLFMLCRRYSIIIRNICLMYNYRVHVFRGKNRMTNANKLIFSDAKILAIQVCFFYILKNWIYLIW